MPANASPTALNTAPGRRILALLCAVAFLDFVDASITNVALPHIRTALHFTTTGLQWVPSAYLLTYGGFMLVGGRLADLLGRRNVLVAGTTLVGLASMAGGFAGNADLFVCARLAQGLGAALMLPAALSILTTTFTDEADRRKALGVWGAVAGLSSAVGILLGGVLTEGPGWRWVMFVNPIACAVVLPAVLGILPRGVGAALVSKFDALGGALITGGMLLLVFALVKAPSQGWGSARTWWELAGAAALIVAFVLNELAVSDPILPLDVLRIRGLVAANLTGLIGFAGMLSMFFFLTLYMQNVLGYSPLEAGAAYLPLTFGIGISAGIGSKLLPKLGSRTVICAGALIAAAGLALLSRVPLHGSYVGDVLPGILLVSLGVGPVFVGVTTAANADVPPEQAGLAAAILNSAQQIGGALGLAIFSAIAASRTSHLLANGAGSRTAATGGFHRALLTGAAFAAASALIALRTVNTHESPEGVGHDVASSEPADTAAIRVLIVGKSQVVLDDAVALLRDAGYAAEATNRFDDVLTECDVTGLDIVVFGGQVPPETKVVLQRAISAVSPDAVFVQGLSGIAGLLASQVKAAATNPADDPGPAPSFDPGARAITISLPQPRTVSVTAWWGTSFVPPTPKSDSRTLFSGLLPAGGHVVELPAFVPDEVAFATVTVDDVIYNFSVATG